MPEGKGGAILVSLFLLVTLSAGLGTASQERRMDLGVRCESTDFLAKIDGRGGGVITNPATLKSAGMESAQFGDRLLITGNAKDALEVRNLCSGATADFLHGFSVGQFDLGLT